MCTVHSVMTKTGQFRLSCHTFINLDDNTEVCCTKGLCWNHIRMRALTQTMAGVINNLDCPLYSVTGTSKLVPALHCCDTPCCFVDSRSVVGQEDVALDRHCNLYRL